MEESQSITVYASFKEPDRFNGTSNNLPCVLVSGQPWPMDNAGVAQIVIPFKKLYIDFDGEVTVLPCESVPVGSGETRYCDVIPLNWLIEDDDWVGAYIRSLDVAISVKWLH